jgi:hypothetical protein
LNERINAPRERDRRKRLTREKRLLITEHLEISKRHKCALEGPDCKGELVLDHVNNNPNDDRLRNWQYLCRRHNRLKLRSFANKPVSVREEAAKEEVNPSDNLLLVSERMQNDLIGWLFKKLGPGGPHIILPIRYVKKEASFDCHISPVTIDRYLVNPGPLTASNAPFRLVEVHTRGDRPGRKTKCIMWRGRSLLELDTSEDLQPPSSADSSNGHSKVIKLPFVEVGQCSRCKKSDVPLRPDARGQWLQCGPCYDELWGGP